MANRMATEGVKKMNLPLPAALHEAIFREARRAGLPATQLVRRILLEWLDARRRSRVAEDIAAYAEDHAGTSLDLDAELELAAIAELQRLTDDETR